MKKIQYHLAFFLLMVSAAFILPKTGSAQDPLKVGPNIYKLLFENEKVRVFEVTFKPGDKMPTHSHPEHLLYVLKPGQLKVTPAGGEAHTIDAKAGEVLWGKAETHVGENVGTTEVKAVLVELK